MKNRRIKFRAVFEYNKGLCYWNLYDNIDFDLIKIETVQQYTGLIDKTGKEIYEGDTLRCSGGKFKSKYDEFTKTDMVAEGAVVFYMGCFWCVDFPLSDYDEIEIIGNIFETPDLLK